MMQNLNKADWYNAAELFTVETNTYNEMNVIQSRIDINCKATTYESHTKKKLK